MELRKLADKDALFMLEWMHDVEVIKYMRTDFLDKSLEDCKKFIAAAQDSSHSLHLAIVDKNDDYLGTVSLKNIINGCAEFGIVVRRCAMGKGYSRQAMERIISEGFTKHGLRLIYWCVNPENARAIRFYEKNGYERCDVVSSACGYSIEEMEHFAWFCVTRDI